jgi:hypothetical protein
MQWHLGIGGTVDRGVPIFSPQAKGSIEWAFLMKCTEDIFWTIGAQQNGDYIHIEDRIERHETKWMRWALDKKIISPGTNLKLTGRRLVIRDDEILWVMIFMR